jgi:uncharacterized protein YgbK (DUF1537 family)
MSFQPPTRALTPEQILVSLPPPRHELPAVIERVREARRKIVVLDDDPTGTQTVHGIDVLTEWSEPSLAAALADPRPCFFVLTNSRSLPRAAAVELTRVLAANLRAAAKRIGCAYTVISRSDSTLRGHFPAEIEALAEGDARGCDGVVIAPAFFEAGSVTIDDVHYVREGGHLVPAGETEFARDVTFGYRSSNLRQWIEEKTGGAVPADQVASVSLATLRRPDGAQATCDQLLALPRGAFVIVNAADYGDFEVFVNGLLLAEPRRCFWCRTAASFVRVRAGLAPIPLLEAGMLRSPDGHGGLVVVGSYTEKTTAQLDAVRRETGRVALELQVSRLAERDGRAAEIARLVPIVDQALREDQIVVVFTSRERATTLGRAGELGVGRTVSDALVELVRGVSVRPRFVIAKGGITSSDVAVHALDVRRALILGQAAPGIPVWRMGPESRFPGMPYIVFPGNVGEPGTLAQLLENLRD